MAVTSQSFGKEMATIVQFSDEGTTLPDGSKIVYAENDEKIVLYHKHPLEKGKTYSFDRATQKVFVNGKEGTNEDKHLMIELGTYLLEHSDDEKLETVNVFAKENA